MKDVLYYFFKGQGHKAYIILQANLIYNKMKFIRWMNRVWLDVWPIFFSLPIMLMIIGSYLQMKKDYSLIHNYANIDAYNEGIYSGWRTDGNPGISP